MNRNEVLQLVAAAHAEGKVPDLRGADLQDANLRGADLRGADLQDANLEGANLQFVDLRHANLEGANLQFVDLRRANLEGANLQFVDLHSARWDGLQINTLPSGTLTLAPTPPGWKLHIGCWKGTPDQLRTLIAQNDDWPEATGKEITRRRPYLQAALHLCEIHMEDNAHTIEKLEKLWQTNPRKEQKTP